MVQKQLKFAALIIAAIIVAALLVFALGIFFESPQEAVSPYAEYALQYFFLNVSNATILVPPSLAKYANIFALNNDHVISNSSLYNLLFTANQIPFSGYVLLTPSFSQPGIIKFSSHIYVNQSFITRLYPELSNCVGAVNKSLSLITCNYLSSGLISLLINSSGKYVIKSTLVYTYPSGIINYTFPLVGKQVANYVVLFYNDTAYLIPDYYLSYEYWKLLFSTNYIDDYLLYKVVKV
jgi:hypothetical protein